MGIYRQISRTGVARLLRIAGADIEDAIEVLRTAGLYPTAQLHLAAAKVLTKAAIGTIRFKAVRNRSINDAIKQLKGARGAMLG